MKIYRNLAEIKKKERLGRRITLGGLLILLLGLVSSFTPNWLPPGEPVANGLMALIQNYWVYVSFGALAIGFLASNIGSYYINRYAPRRWPETKRIARPDELVENSLKGFDDKYGLFLWSVEDAPYLLAGPPGILLFAVRADKGTVRVSGDRWREAFSLGRIFTSFTREGVGNPARDVEEMKQKVREMLQAGNANGSLDIEAEKIPVEGAVLFINPAVTLEVDGPSIPVLRTEQLKKFIRSHKKNQLNGAQVRALTDFLHEQSLIVEA